MNVCMNTAFKGCKIILLYPNMPKEYTTDVSNKVSIFATNVHLDVIATGGHSSVYLLK